MDRIFNMRKERQELPVNVKISYYLDEKIKPEELAGAMGNSAFGLTTKTKRPNRSK